MSLKDNVKCRLGFGPALIAAGALLSPASATITMTKTLVAEPPAAFTKGVEFPLLGLHDSKATFVSARVFKWSQRPGEMYVLEPTQDFTVYPQLVRMGSDSRKTITIKAAQPLPTDSELHYRIVLREFDRADGTDVPVDDVAMAIVAKPQISIPMIVRGPASAVAAPMQIDGVRAAPPIADTAKAKEAPTSILTIYNPGQVYQRVVAVAVNAAPGLSNQMLGYVLPGQHVELGLRDIGAGAKITVQYVDGPDAKVDWSAANDDRKSVSVVAP